MPPSLLVCGRASEVRLSSSTTELADIGQDADIIQYYSHEVGHGAGLSVRLCCGVRCGYRVASAVLTAPDTRCCRVELECADHHSRALSRRVS